MLLHVLESGLRGETKQFGNFLVGDLGKVIVELPDGVKEFRGFDANQLVDFATETAAGGLWSDGNCDDQSSRL